MLDDALDIVDDLERDDAEQFGSARFAALEAELAAPLEHIDPAGSLGREWPPGQRSNRQRPVEGSMTADTGEMWLAGKPPQRACS
jgi:hypothetical protein